LVSAKEIFSDDGKNKMVKEYLYTDGEKFALQISSWKTRLVAEKEIARLRKTGLDAYILILNPNTSSPLYCVRYGDFSTISEAEQFLKKIK
jgi:cell division septation protein DedD